MLECRPLGECYIGYLIFIFVIIFQPIEYEKKECRVELTRLNLPWSANGSYDISNLSPMDINFECDMQIKEEPVEDYCNIEQVNVLLYHFHHVNIEENVRKPPLLWSQEQHSQSF